MQIIHRISLNTRINATLFQTVERLGLPYDATKLSGKSSLLVTFEITEANDDWPVIEERIRGKRVVDLVETTFEPEEIVAAQRLRLRVTYEHGYPQPEETWVRDPSNYKGFCPECGTFEQSAPFTIAKEPNLRGHNFMTLHWGSAIFCSPSVGAQFEESGFTGFEIWPVSLAGRDSPSTRIVQIHVPSVSRPGLLIENDLEIDDCSACGKRKIEYHKRGIMRYRAAAISSNLDFENSGDWFGAGSRRAFREVFVSQRVAQLALAEQWEGVRFKVLELCE